MKILKSIKIKNSKDLWSDETLSMPLAVAYFGTACTNWAVGIVEDFGALSNIAVI